MLHQRQIILIAGAAERLHGPQRLPAREAERAESIRIGKTLQHAWLQACTQPHVANGNVGRYVPLTFLNDQLCIFFRNPFDLAEAEPHGML
jgi:hypothetical protein